ncbi:SusC/RagA family TonB-linked outer membrane protein [Bacteroides thetaiotaomicron]|uniref:SusC/RagA family TonB-linked outer membrane protein n=1 Tax=Bacteroides thetaiotaomicron TaxID=818 RepID=UPI001F1B3A6E|nr:TonB-dependent receptor [Bacteroides thetaiotaomicron]MCE8491252.1 TonB-dependent receptor [Bacteroides thetaiotaomicron]
MLKYLKSIGVILLLACISTGVVYAAANPSVAEVKITQQSDTCRGIVKDAAGEIVVGASVIVKGTTNGVITDVDGNFSLSKVQKGNIIQISFVGYRTEEITWDGLPLKVILQDDTQELQEMVVVGYASQKKVNLSGSVSSVNMEDIAEKRPITNLSSGLAGMAAGILVTSSSNVPGNDNTSILVRGQGTLNNSSPLIIIDGVESNINTVAPQDVESMSVLKDAASAAIYGSRAANGVILITTKKGKEGKINIDYTGYASIESVGKTPDLVSNYADFMEYKNEGWKNSGSGEYAKYSKEDIDAWRNDAGRNPLLFPNTDWVEELFKTAVATNHNLSMSGGTDKLFLYTSFGYNNNPGIVEKSGYERYSFRSNVEAKPTKWFTLGVKLNGYFSNNAIASNKIGSLFGDIAGTVPGIVPRHPDGRFGGAQAKGEDLSQTSPLKNLYSLDGNKKERNFRAAFNGTITPFKGLSISGSYSYELTDYDDWEKNNLLDSWNFVTETISNKDGNRQYIYAKNGKLERMFMDGVIRYENRFFNNRLDLIALIGASQEMRRDRTFSGKKYDPIDDSVDVINGASGDAETSGSHSEWTMRSYFGRINLGWDNKYLLEMNLRADASSRFLKKNRWGYFPSFSAAWRIDQEAFMEKTRAWLNTLKLRASYGELGNNAINNYTSIATYSKVMYGLGDQYQLGMTQSSLANGSLTWESTAVTNFGVDFGVLNNRLTGTAEYFYKKTSDILIALPAPLVHGNSGIPTQNSAEVVNKGFELTFNWQDKINDFHFNIGTNITFVDNKVTKFKGNEPSISGSTMIKEGYPINVQYVLIADRIIQTQEDLDYVQSLIDNAPLDKNGNKINPFSKYKRPELGDVLYKDANNDYVIDDDDRVARGHGNTPRFFYDINIGCDWKGLDFSILMSGIGNNKVQYQTMHTTALAPSGYQIGKEVAEGRWYEGRTTFASYPRFLINDSRNTRNSTLWETNKRYLKIRNIQLGYTLPQAWVKAASLNRVRVFCSLENFFTFTDYAGMDPETSGFSYPTIRQASFGLNVSF